MAYQHVNVLNVSLPPSSNLHAQLSTTPLLGEQKGHAKRSEKEFIGCSCTIL